MLNRHIRLCPLEKYHIDATVFIFYTCISSPSLRFFPCYLFWLASIILDFFWACWCLSSQVFPLTTSKAFPVFIATMLQPDQMLLQARSAARQELRQFWPPYFSFNFCATAFGHFIPRGAPFSKMCKVKNIQAAGLFAPHLSGMLPVWTNAKPHLFLWTLVLLCFECAHVAGFCHIALFQCLWHQWCVSACVAHVDYPPCEHRGALWASAVFCEMF